MTETPERRVISLSLPDLATAAPARPTAWDLPDPRPPSAGSPDDALLGAIRTVERLAHWCGRYTPWTAMDDDGGVWLDISGCQHLFGGEPALLDDLTRRVEAQGLKVRAAVADTPGAAWAVARFGGEAAVEIVAPGAQWDRLAPLPAAALRLEAEAAEGLRRLGIRRVGDLYGIARAPLAARFGPEVLKRLDQALGRHEEPISPIRPPPSRRVRMTFPDPIGVRDDLWRAFERLLTALLDRLAAVAEGIRRLELAGYRADGTVVRLAVGLGRAGRDADHIRRLVHEKFDRLDPGFGIEVMVLSALATEPVRARQPSLAGDADAGDDLARLVDRLRNRLGGDGVGALDGVERHLPERAQRPRPFALSLSPSPAPSSGGGEGPVLERPLDLLSPPERIEAMAPVPDGPPVLFKWRRRTHKVVRSDGPERIAPEWWLEDPARLASGQARVRDYYRVEDDRGDRYWLYRAGLYQTDKPPQWYLHGLFG